MSYQLFIILAQQFAHGFYLCSVDIHAHFLFAEKWKKAFGIVTTMRTAKNKMKCVCVLFNRESISKWMMKFMKYFSLYALGYRVRNCQAISSNNNTKHSLRTVKIRPNTNRVCPFDTSSEILFEKCSLLIFGIFPLNPKRLLAFAIVEHVEFFNFHFPFRAFVLIKYGINI